MTGKAKAARRCKRKHGDGPPFAAAHQFARAADVTPQQLITQRWHAIQYDVLPELRTQRMYVSGGVSENDRERACRVSEFARQFVGRVPHGEDEGRQGVCCGFRLPHSERYDRDRGRGNSVVQSTVGAWLVSVVVKRFSRAGYDSGLE